MIQIAKQKPGGFVLTPTPEAFQTAIQTVEMVHEKAMSNVMIMVYLMGTGAPRLAK